MANEQPSPQPAYYAVIPAAVLNDPKLSHSQMILYARITSLCSDIGYCYASNGYLAEIMGVTETSIRRWVTDLVESGYLIREIITDPETKEVKARHLYINDTPSAGLRSDLSVGLQTPLSAPTDASVCYTTKAYKDSEGQSPSSSKTTTTRRRGVKAKQVGLFDPPEPPKPKVPRKQRLELPWSPPSELHAAAVKAFPTMDIDYETKQFISWVITRGIKSLDWIEEWKSYIRRSDRNYKNRGQSNGGQKQELTIEDLIYMQPADAERAMKEGRVNID